MTDATTIKLSQETKAALDNENLSGETFDDTVARLLGNTHGSVWTEEEIRTVVREEIKAVQNRH